MRRLVIMLAWLGSLAACGGTPREFSEADSIREGPGLLTGDLGAIVITPSGIQNWK